MQHSNFIDWSEDFDNVGRELRSKSRTSSSWSSTCFINGEEVDCETGEPKENAPAWLVAVIIGVIVVLVAVILVCVATKKCKKKFKCARIAKCCKKGNT